MGTYMIQYVRGEGMTATGPSLNGRPQGPFLMGHFGTFWDICPGLNEWGPLSGAAFCCILWQGTLPKWVRNHFRCSKVFHVLATSFANRTKPDISGHRSDHLS